MAAWNERGDGTFGARSSSQLPPSASKAQRSPSSLSPISTPARPPKTYSFEPSTACAWPTRAGGADSGSSACHFHESPSSVQTWSVLSMELRAIASPPKRYALPAIALSLCDERAHGALRSESFVQRARSICVGCAMSTAEHAKSTAQRRR